jgi:hypothetical protein
VHMLCSAPRCGGSSTRAAGPRVWMRARAQEQHSRKIAGRQWRRKRERREEGERGMGSTPPRAALFIRGPQNLPVVVPSVVQYASTDLFREVCEKISADSPLIG